MAPTLGEVDHCENERMPMGREPCGRIAVARAAGCPCLPVFERSRDACHRLTVIRIAVTYSLAPMRGQ